MLRVDQEIIADMVQQGDRVLDLGCGDGALLLHLQRTKQIRGYGLDLGVHDITKCLQNGVNVIEQNLDDGLLEFETNAFDTVIMAETLQATRRPDKLLAEMLRIGKTCIVTLPNFGHWRCRLQLLGSGLMPVFGHLPHQWYETPNIHLCTFRDFERLCLRCNFAILERRVVGLDYREDVLSSWLPNLFGAFGLYRLRKVT